MAEENEREIVLSILQERAHTKKYSNVLIRRALDAHDAMDQQKKAFVKRLAEGVIEREKELDAVIRAHLKNPRTSIKGTIWLILRMGVYQILYMDSVPDFAAVNESLKLARAHHLAAQTGFLNAVLRSICRDKEQGQKPGEKTVYIAMNGASRRVTRSLNQEEQAALSMPEDIRKIWEEDYGKETEEALSKAMMEIRPVCIRFDPRVSEEKRRETEEAIRALGAKVEPAHWVPDCRYLTKIPAVTKLPGFAEGLFTVQDESSALVGMAAGLLGDEKILDLCAAPGGKSVLLACLAPKGTVLSFDLTREKTARIAENARRMHVENITIREGDATQENPELIDSADFVLCDVPCSGLGVITRKRDIKYNADPEKIRSLVRLQRKILDNAVRYVRPGGILLYSTCTIDLAENNRQAAYLEKQLGMEPTDLAPFLPKDMPGIEGNCLQLFPHIHRTDGFFLARFRKPEKANG